MAEPSAHYVFACIARAGLGLYNHDTNLVAGQDDTNRSCHYVFRDISDCEPHAAVSTCGIAADLVFLEDTYRWYVLRVTVL